MRFCLKLFEFKKKLIHFFDFFNFNQLDTRLNKDSSEVNKIKVKDRDNRRDLELKISLTSKRNRDKVLFHLHFKVYFINFYCASSSEKLSMICLNFS
jgi:hypothetical protein